MKIGNIVIRSIKVLQWTVLAAFVLIVINTLIVFYWFRASIDDFVKLLGALGPYIFPMFGFAFAGNPLKKFIENQKTNIKLKATINGEET